MPVALRGAGVGALVRGGADRGGQLRLDQRLVERLGRGADAVIDVGELECLEEFKQGRLVQGQRVAFLLRVPWRVHAEDPRGGSSLPGTTPTSSEPPTSYTTSGDVTRVSMDGPIAVSSTAPVDGT